MKYIIEHYKVWCALAIILVASFSAIAANEHGKDAHAGHDDDHAGATHEDHKEEHGKDAHAGHDDEHGEALTLSAADLKELNIKVVKATSGELAVSAKLLGEVRLNEDRLAHVVPTVPGVVRSVEASLGDVVKPGDRMAVLASRTLAETKANHLAAHAQVELTQVTYNREKKLWEDKISSEQDFLQARNTLEKARIEMRASEQRLYALGLTEKAIHHVEQESNAELTHLEVLAPFTGTVIEKHITLGEAVGNETPVFVVADLSTVWVDLNVYAKDLLLVLKGQKVIISTDAALPDVQGTIAYIGPVVGEETRTAMVRVILPNPEGLWRPGMFVKAEVTVDEREVAVKVPKSALFTVEGKTVVFTQDKDGFEAVEVTLGRADQEGAEVLSGLKVGQAYVAQGGFYLKSELAKAAFAGDGHAH